MLIAIALAIGIAMCITIVIDLVIALAIHAIAFFSGPQGAFKTFTF